MGYSTEFKGEFRLNKPLAPEHKAYLEKFAETRRFKRNESITATRPDPIREAVGLPAGTDGGYFVGLRIPRHREYSAPDVVDYNREPAGQPSLWCQWVPSDDGSAIKWDGGEKFYDYVEWLEYIIQHFLTPWGYTLNGDVQWQGEEPGDIGLIVVKDSVVTATPSMR